MLQGGTSAIKHSLFAERTAFPRESKYPMPFVYSFSVILEKKNLKKKNLKSTANPALAIVSCSVQKIIQVKGFFPCQQATKSAGKLQFISCLVIVQVIHLTFFHLKNQRRFG